MRSHEYYMELALAQAQLAWSIGEVPVGAVVVDDEGNVVGAGCNRTLSTHDPSAHAEMVALRNVGQNLKNYRLPDLTMYVTLEPCTMCSGLLVHARLKALYFGAPDPRTGACGSVYNVLGDKRHNHQVQFYGGILKERCAKILVDFFKLRRSQIKQTKSKRIAQTLGLQKIPSNVTKNKKNDKACKLKLTNALCCKMIIQKRTGKKELNVKSRNSIRNEINNIYNSKITLWLTEHVKNNKEIQGFPIRIYLGAPAREEEIASDKELFLAFCDDWHRELAAGKVDFIEKEFRSIGKLEVPVHLVFEKPEEIVAWCGHLVEYRTALKRLDIVAERIPSLVDSALENISSLTSLEDLDFKRFVEVCRWLLKHPASGSMIRQMNLRGVDSAWFEEHRGLLLQFLRSYLKLNPLRKDLRQLGLVPPPQLVRAVVLDPALRKKLGGLRYLAFTAAEAQTLELKSSKVIFMEDLTSALSLPDIPGTVAVILPNGSLKQLCSSEWIAQSQCVFLGSVGFGALVRLNNIRVYLPKTQSRLLTEDFFMENEDLWSADHLTSSQVPVETPLLLTADEKLLYNLFVDRIVRQLSVNIPQERVPFDVLCLAAGAVLPPANSEHVEEDSKISKKESSSENTTIVKEQPEIKKQDDSKDHENQEDESPELSDLESL